MAVALALLSAAAAAPQRPAAALPGGAVVRGRVLPSGVAEFLGVPYAEPPVGARRFAPSVLRGGGGDLAAGEYGPACVQAPGSYPKMSEDCLYANVWAPRNAAAGGAGLPVFVWVHGGGFMSGSGADYNASHLAAQGLVAVTFNYRLAALGFYASPALAAERGATGGMNGLGDQVVLLQWVQQNIAAFGGNPDEVTLAGESAGGISVSLLLHAPAAAGLYRRAVAESGSCVVAFHSGLPRTASEGAAEGRQWAAGLGCAAVDEGSALRCLRALPAANLTASPLWYAVRPSVDGDLIPSEPFGLPLALPPQRPAQLIVGSTSLDTVCAPPWSDGSGGGAAGTAPWPADCDAYRGNLSAAFGHADAAQVLEHYPCPSAPAGSAVAKQWLRISRDVSILCPMAWLADKAAAAAGEGAEVRAYEFAYNTAAGWEGLAAHGAELGYVFDDPSSGYFPAQGFNSSLAATMSHYWSSFARGGRPEGPVRWPLYGGDSQGFLRFGPAGPSAESGYGAGGQCAFWRGYLARSNFTGAPARRYRAMVENCFH